MLCVSCWTSVWNLIQPNGNRFFLNINPITAWKNLPEQLQENYQFNIILPGLDWTIILRPLTLVWLPELPTTFIPLFNMALVWWH